MKENKDTDQMLIVAGSLLGLAFFAYFLFFAAPLLVISFCFSLFLWIFISKRISLKRIALALSGLVGFWFLFFGGFGFQGLGFLYFRDLVKAALDSYISFFNNLVIEKWEIKVVTEASFRQYVWLSPPLTFLGTAFLLLKRDSPLSLGLEALRSHSLFGSNGKDLGIEIGHFKDRPFKKFYLTEKALNHHVHICGASGFGKSVLIHHILRDRIRKGKGLIFIDLKGDMETLLKLNLWAKETNRERDLKVFSLGGSEGLATYNPLKRGNSDQISDRIMEAYEWSEEFYRGQASKNLKRIVRTLVYLRDHESLSVTFQEIKTCLSSTQRLLELKERLPEERADLQEGLEEVIRFLKDKELDRNLEKLRGHIDDLCLTEFGDRLINREDGIDFLQAVEKSEIIYFVLSSRDYPSSAKNLAKMITEDIKALTAHIDATIPETERRGFQIIIDEFAEFAQDSFISFLDRTRSSKIGCVIAHQELADLRNISPTFEDRLLNNCSTSIIFQSKIQESAEKLASLAGTRTTFKETERSSRLIAFDHRTGDKSLRQTEEFLVHPNVIKRLQVGECYVTGSFPKKFAGVVKVKRPVTGPPSRTS
jgi:hypothetical protein